VKHAFRPLQRLLGVKVIAIVGCDGSGKSTLAHGLIDQLRCEMATQFIYLGQSSGRIKDWIGRLPILGAPLAAYLVSKSENTHAHQSMPVGIVTALAMYLLSRWRTHKFRRLLRLDRRGTLVITDRYPQAEIPGFHFDGPELPTKNPGGRTVRKLAAREERLYRWMAGHVPLLVIRLNVDVATAHARKPDHKLAELGEKIAVLPRLGFNGARIVDLDGREPASLVLDAALQEVRAVLGMPHARPASEHARV
jgi:hypothetical protein